MRDAERVEAGDRVGNAFGPAVGDVVAGQRHRNEAGPRERVEVLGPGRRRGHVTRQLRSTVRMRHLEVTDCEIGGADRGRNAREPVIRILDVEHEVAGEDNHQVAWRARRRRQVLQNVRHDLA
jgi:hypothetical protein